MKYFDLPKPYSKEDEQRIMQEKLQKIPGAVSPTEREMKLEALQRAIASVQGEPEEPVDLEGLGEVGGATDEVVNPDDISEPVYDEEILKKEALLEALKNKLNMR